MNTAASVSTAALEVSDLEVVYTVRGVDRAVLRALLPSLSGAQLQVFFGDTINAIALPAARDWTWYRASVGQLITDARALEA